MGEYSNAKIDGEKIVKFHHNYIIIRPGAIYGPDINGKFDNRTLALINELEKEEEVERTENLYNTFVKVDELAIAIKKLIEIDYKGIINLGPKTKESYYNFFVKVAKNLNLNSTLIKSNTLTDDDIWENDRCLDLSLDTSKARRLLGDIFSDI